MNRLLFGATARIDVRVLPKPSSRRRYATSGSAPRRVLGPRLLSRTTRPRGTDTGSYTRVGRRGTSCGRRVRTGTVRALPLVWSSGESEHRTGDQMPRSRIRRLSPSRGGRGYYDGVVPKRPESQISRAHHQGESAPVPTDTYWCGARDRKTWWTRCVRTFRWR